MKKLKITGSQEQKTNVKNGFLSIRITYDVRNTHKTISRIMSDIQKIAFKTNEQWRHERAKSVGASAIGTILGYNRHSTAAQLAEKMKAELRGEFDYTQTLAMMRGHAYEGGVAQIFERLTGYKIIQASSVEYLVRRTDTPFLHASPDRIYWIDFAGPQHGPLAETNKGVLECKTTRHSVKPNAIPPSWILQLQAQMGLTGYHSGHLAWDVLSKTEGFGYAAFTFDPRLFFAIVDVCREFWHRSVIGNEPPRGRYYLAGQHPILYSDSWKQPQHVEFCTAATVIRNEPHIGIPLPTYEYTVDDADDDQEQEQKKPAADNISFFERLWQHITSKE